MQYESWTRGPCHLYDVLKSLGYEYAQKANLVTRHSLDTRVCRHKHESARVIRSCKESCRSGAHRASKDKDILLLKAHVVQTELIDVLSIFLYLFFTRISILPIDAVAWVLHTEHADITVVCEGGHLLLRQSQALRVAVEIEEKLRARLVTIVPARDMRATLGMHRPRLRFLSDDGGRLLLLTLLLYLRVVIRGCCLHARRLCVGQLLVDLALAWSSIWTG